MIRAFVGLPVPEEVARVLEGAQAGLQIGHLVPRENLHLTLAFLGEHPEPVIEDVHDGLSMILAPRVEVKTTGLGLFGGERPRLMFADVEATEPLKALRKKVRQAAHGHGVTLSSERFHPHITLARFGRGVDGEDALAVGVFAARNQARARVDFVAESFCLYRSYLGRQGPIYEVLAEYPLSERARSTG